MEQLTVVLLLFGTFTLNAANYPVYEKVGDTVVLTPDSAVDPGAPFKSIVWNHGADTAVDWFGGEPSYRRHFKGRSALNISTGALTITGLMRNDSGSYGAEINNKTTNPTQLLVISPVPKPTISMWCDSEMTHCGFTCEGNTTGAEPVTYGWRMSDYVLTSTKVHNITKEEVERSFKCMMENPVSYKGSDPVLNPFPRRDADGTPPENVEMISPGQQPPVDEEAAEAEVQ
ncbi:CD48 antigen-like isoform X2 [Cebidichthys violaceus]|uniref:CD48 antigen-like isoform X2 n=1 Tax=Cebidichthys violaceus TaxID=271503 RepID=UPI0035CB214B